MITIYLQGGLGNQLFQYAYARSLKERGYKVVIDTSFYKSETIYTKRKESLFFFSITLSCRELFKKSICNVVRNRLLSTVNPSQKVAFYKKNLSPKINAFCDDFYQSEKYFLSMRKILLTEIVLKETPEKKEYLFFKELLMTKNSLVVHARRGDYSSASTNGLKVKSEDYFKKALTYFDKNHTIFLFSDEPKWIKKIVEDSKPNTEIYIVSGKGLTDYEEFSLMTFGKNFIIPNSTFGWWGAWLSQNETKKVIAPKVWFTGPKWRKANEDIVPNEWIRI